MYSPTMKVTMSAQTSLVTSGFFLLINLVVLIGIYWLYRQNKKALGELEQDKKEIVIASQKQAEQVIADARDKARKIVSQSEYFKQELMTSLEESFREVADKDLTLLENKSVEINEFYKKLLESISNKHLKKTEDTLK